MQTVYYPSYNQMPMNVPQYVYPSFPVYQYVPVEQPSKEQPLAQQPLAQQPHLLHQTYPPQYVYVQQPLVQQPFTYTHVPVQTPSESVDEPLEPTIKPSADLQTDTQQVYQPVYPAYHYVQPQYYVENKEFTFLPQQTYQAHQYQQVQA